MHNFQKILLKMSVTTATLFLMQYEDALIAAT